MRVVLSLLMTCLVAACAPYVQDPNAADANAEKTLTTGSNIPRKGSNAIVVDKSVVQDQQIRQGGSLQR